MSEITMDIRHGHLPGCRDGYSRAAAREWCAERRLPHVTVLNLGQVNPRPQGRAIVGVLIAAAIFTLVVVSQKSGGGSGGGRAHHVAFGGGRSRRRGPPRRTPSPGANIAGTTGSTAGTRGAAIACAIDRRPAPVSSRAAAATGSPLERLRERSAARQLPSPRRRRAPGPELHAGRRRPTRDPGEHRLHDLRQRLHQRGAPPLLVYRAARVRAPPLVRPLRLSGEHRARPPDLARTGRRARGSAKPLPRALRGPPRRDGQGCAREPPPRRGLRGLDQPRDRPARDPRLGEVPGAGTRSGRGSVERVDFIGGRWKRASSGGGSNCDPNYSGACLDPNASDYDCAGGGGDGPKYVQGPIHVTAPTTTTSTETATGSPA